MAYMWISSFVLFVIVQIEAGNLPPRTRRDTPWYHYYDMYEDTDCSDLDYHCKRSSSEPLCSGHGPCFCGECLCDPISMERPSIRYSGKYCECDDYSCPFHQHEPCGGSERGDCSCGRCHCKPGYYGNDCRCRVGTDDRCP